MLLLPLAKTKKFYLDSDETGLTITETLVGTLAIGILAAVAISSWQSFIEISNLNTAQYQVYNAMRQAQSQAVKEKLTWQVSFREHNGIVQWAVHKADAQEFLPDSLNRNDQLWSNLDQGIRIEQGTNNRGKKETTISKHSSQAVWRVLFNYYGCPVYRVGDECTNTSLRTLGQITFYSQKGGKSRRCVYVSTILGVIKMGKENTRVNDTDKYCY